jgi:hypothetical protein
MSMKLKPKSYARRSVTLILLVGVLGGVVVGGGVTVIAASNTETVTMCANKKTNVVRYAKNGKCVKTETKVVLNQTGPAGATGIGITGATGPKGDAGVNAAVAITQQAVCDGFDDDIVANELCNVGMTGPSGGLIFFVDYNDQYAEWNYLEAAPFACESSPLAWSSDTTNALVEVDEWKDRAVGRGQANTTAMMSNVFNYVADTSGAAFFADSLICGGKSDWFLGSVGEMKLMYDNLQGLGRLQAVEYWCSNAEDTIYSIAQGFGSGTVSGQLKTTTFLVRPVRSF